MPHRSRSRIFSGFPWASLGRRESSDELFRKLAEQASRVPLLSHVPRISLVMTVPRGIVPRHLRESIDSIEAQSYPHWELIIVSKDELTVVSPPRAIVVKTAFASEAEAKHAGAARASGSWIGFLRAGDVLSPACLFQVAWELEQASQAGVFFTNEVTVDTSSRQLSRFLSKSEFSRFNLWHFDAIGAFWTARRDLFEAAGGIDPKEDCYAETACLLRMAEQGAAFRHIPFYFYHRREGDTPVKAGKEGWAERVRESVARSGLAAQVEILPAGGDRRIKVIPDLPESRPLVSAIICFRDRGDWTVQSAQALARQAGVLPLEILLVDNDSRERELAKVAAMLPTLPCAARLVSHSGPFNFGHMHNCVVREHARGELLLLLNNDVFLEGEKQLDEWAAWAWQSWVGTVGIQLRYAHGAVQHSGICARFGGEARLVRVGHSASESELSHESREVFANTFAACLMKRSVYEAVGGLRQIDMANGFGDVAFNFDCLRRGWRNLYLGHLGGVHLESASRGRGTSYEYWEERALEREYPDILERMLRCDFGYDRIPSGEHSIPRAVGQALRIKFRQSTPWLDPLKPALKKVLWSWQQRGQNRSEA